MSDTIITVQNVSKRYLIGHQFPRERYTTVRDVISRSVRGLARKTADVLRGRQFVQGDEVEEFWALRNVSFEVKQGEVVGIIGHNGAGKSTLLKILSRITEPTEGRIEFRGRVAGLLEIGTGFHPELTGRENIFLNGSILGMAQREIRKKFDEIVAFADVERFLDTPVKRFSSGMQVRLAFAIAAHLEPEILIIDEVLAVGDASFQKKCLGKMEDVSRRDGRTVLFVSHNVGVITALCPFVIWLDHGVVRKQGNAREVVGEYLANSTTGSAQVNLSSVPTDRDGKGGLRLSSFEWLSGLPLRHGESVRGRIRFDVQVPVEDVAFGIGFSNLEGCRLLTYETRSQEGFHLDIARAGTHCVEFEVNGLPLAPDVYNVDIGCGSQDVNSLDYMRGAMQIEVVGGVKTAEWAVRSGTGVRLASKWEARI